MIIDGSVFGELRGKLSLSSEDALDFFGYRMKDGAKGVYFQVKKGKQIIASLVPPSIPNTPRQLQVQERWRGLWVIVKGIKPLIKGVWDMIAKRMGRLGVNLFFEENGRLVGLPADWSKLLLTKGELSAPCVGEVVYGGNALRLRLVREMSGIIGVGVFEPRMCRFHLIERSIEGRDVYISFACYLKSPFVYVYRKEYGLYSMSVCVKARHGKVFE